MDYISFVGTGDFDVKQENDNQVDWDIWGYDNSPED